MITCVLSSKVSAIITHEAIGHMAEADFVLACAEQSLFRTLSQISEKITVIDYAHTAFSEACPVPIHVDDEGTTAQDVCLIKEGQCDSLMTNIYTAKALSLPLTGNARIASDGEQPQVRMRNTAMLPGDDDPADIIASVKDGYYLVDGTDAYGDINGDFFYKVTEGYRIRNGQIYEPICECVLCGQTTNFLQSISMVGNDFKWYVDECYKWDTVQVGQGAPTIKACLEIMVM